MKGICIDRKPVAQSDEISLDYFYEFLRNEVYAGLELSKEEIEKVEQQISIKNGHIYLFELNREGKTTIKHSFVLTDVFANATYDFTGL